MKPLLTHWPRHFYLDRERYLNDVYSLHFITYPPGSDAKPAAAQGVAFIPFDESAALASTAGPMVHLREAELQQLMEELWKEGIRPKDLGGSVDVRAVQKHLDDMRRIVFHALKVPGGKWE